MGLKVPEPETIGFDMTPMIDITFQLIIFFMLTMDMAQQEIEAVVLPTASEAKEDKNPDKERLMVNVVHADLPCAAYDAAKICRDDGHWVVKVRGKVHSFPALTQELYKAALAHPDPENPKISGLPLMVRADERAPFGQVQKVLREAAKQKIWKIEIGAKTQKED